MSRSSVWLLFVLICVGEGCEDCQVTEAYDRTRPVGGGWFWKSDSGVRAFNRESSLLVYLLV